MAHFIPSEYDSEKHPYSEEIVYRKLSSLLSNDWVVFHSYNYVRQDEFDQMLDGEIDFLLYHAAHGILVLEVKGGDISYVNGQWFQDGRVIYPFEQAKRNKYSLLQLLEKRHPGGAVPIKLAHAVCFPSCSEGAPQWPAEAQGLVVLRNDLNDIENIAIRLIEQVVLPKGVSGSMAFDAVLDILSPIFDCKQNPKLRMHNDDVEIERLTKQQSHILEVMQNFPRLQIKGGAGTGKTVLAIKKAQMVEQNGGNVLFLCYNELLARKINSKIKKTCYDVSVFALFNFCKEVLHISNEEYEKYRKDARLYSLVLPKMLKEYLDNHALTYDAIIVDEGQDFTKAMWQVIELMVQPNGEFYIFYDPEQNIYCDTLTLPEFGLPPVELTKNCRNTRKIFDAMSEYCDANMEIMEGSPVGCDVRVLYGNCRELLEAELIRLHQVDNIPLCDIVVLGGHSLANTCIGADVQVGPYSICENSLQVVKDSVRYFTYMKFKGCEEKIIILLEADEKDPRWSKAGMYTAMSRAKHQLIILKNDSTVR